jgi:hypothetical protein
MYAWQNQPTSTLLLSCDAGFISESRGLVSVAVAVVLPKHLLSNES